MHITDPLLTAREGATFLQISVPTFWRRVADGTIPPAIKFGGLSRWPQSEISAVIEQAKARRSHNGDWNWKQADVSAAKTSNNGGRAK